jgi:hypothetical protein
MGLLSTKESIHCGSRWATLIKANNRYSLRSKLCKLGKKVLLHWLETRAAKGPKSKTPSEEGSRRDATAFSLAILFH